MVCKEFKGTLNKREGDQEGKVYKQVRGPSVCRCGIQNGLALSLHGQMDTE